MLILSPHDTFAQNSVFPCGFKDAASSCTDCPAGQNCPAGSTMCYDANAPTPAPRTDDGDDFSNDDSPASGCPSGQYEPCSGCLCASCAAGQYQPLNGFTGSACTSCDPGERLTFDSVPMREQYQMP
jgi:hypothetical protein